jgi:hypothetical protein
MSTIGWLGSFSPETFETTRFSPTDAWNADYDEMKTRAVRPNPVLDPTELMGYVNTTLKTVNALLALGTNERRKEVAERCVVKLIPVAGKSA